MTQVVSPNWILSPRGAVIVLLYTCFIEPSRVNLGFGAVVLKLRADNIFTAWVSTSQQVNSGRFQIRRRVLQNLIMLTGHKDTTPKRKKRAGAHSDGDLL